MYVCLKFWRFNFQYDLQRHDLQVGETANCPIVFQTTTSAVVNILTNSLIAWETFDWRWKVFMHLNNQACWILSIGVINLCPIWYSFINCCVSIIYTIRLLLIVMVVESCGKMEDRRTVTDHLHNNHAFELDHFLLKTLVGLIIRKRKELEEHSNSRMVLLLGTIVVVLSGCEYY